MYFSTRDYLFVGTWKWVAQDSIVFVYSCTCGASVARFTAMTGRAISPNHLRRISQKISFAKTRLLYFGLPHSSMKRNTKWTVLISTADLLTGVEVNELIVHTRDDHLMMCIS
eukprot:661439-Amphidinium_carterae.1